MSKIVLCSISDDRSMRKGGLYEATQDKITKIMIQNNFVDEQLPWNINFIINSIEPEVRRFYEENKIMLDNTDAARNGRLYKPYVIRETLKTLDEGDFLIYNDCSPEMWKMGEDFVIDKNIYDLQVIKDLTVKNRDILVAFVKWSPDDFKKNKLGIHTHHYFTLEPCIEGMLGQQYRHSFQCASGMICIRKTEATRHLVERWLRWNKQWRIACIGDPEISADESFWHDKEDYKLGHRSDQSILSLLLNFENWDFVDIVYNDISPYNFLNFCRTDHDYKFINSNIR